MGEKAQKLGEAMALISQGDVERFVRYLRGAATKAGLKNEVRINKAGCF